MAVLRSVGFPTAAARVVGPAFVVGEIYRAIETLGADPGLLACLHWQLDDTLDDGQVREMMASCNEMGEPFSHGLKLDNFWGGSMTTPTVARAIQAHEATCGERHYLKKIVAPTRTQVSRPITMQA